MLKPSSRHVIELVEERLRRRARAPPALALAAAAVGLIRLVVQPSRVISGRTISCAEMWPKCRYGDRPLDASRPDRCARRRSARAIVEERRQPAPAADSPRRASSTGRDAVIDRQARERARRLARRGPASRSRSPAATSAAPRPAAPASRRRRDAARAGRPRERSFSRCAGSVFCRKRRNDAAVGKTRSVARSGSRPLPSTASSDTSSAPAGRRDHPRQEERGKSSVTTTAASSARAASSRPLPSPGCALDVRVVERARPGEAPGRCRHALQHERVQPIARPRIAAAQRLEDDERPPQLRASATARSSAKLERVRRAAIIQ